MHPLSDAMESTVDILSYGYRLYMYLVNFLLFLTRKITFVTSCLLNECQIPSVQRSALIREFGSKFFPFRADSFSK